MMAMNKPHPAGQAFRAKRRAGSEAETRPTRERDRKSSAAG